jgi:hypothetical protein
MTRLPSPPPDPSLPDDPLEDLVRRAEGTPGEAPAIDPSALPALWGEGDEPGDAALVAWMAEAADARVHGRPEPLSASARAAALAVPAAAAAASRPAPSRRRAAARPTTPAPVRPRLPTPARTPALAIAAVLVLGLAVGLFFGRSPDATGGLPPRGPLASPVARAWRLVEGTALRRGPALLIEPGPRGSARVAWRPAGFATNATRILVRMANGEGATVRALAPDGSALGPAAVVHDGVARLRLSAGWTRAVGEGELVLAFAWPEGRAQAARFDGAAFSMEER